MSLFSDELAVRIRSYANKYDKKSPVFFFTKINFWILKFCLQRLSARKLSSHKVNIAILLWGGMGDKIISLQWIYAFIKEVRQEYNDVAFTLFLDHPKQAEMLLGQNNPFDAVKKRSSFTKYKYDLLLDTDNLVLIKDVNTQCIQRFLPKLAKKLPEALTFTQLYKKFDNAQYLGLLMVLCANRGWNRYDLLGACNLCRFDRNSLTLKELDQDFVHQTLQKFSLNSSKFITVHSGIGKRISAHTAGKALSTKTISDLQLEEICTEIKKNFPDYTIVQLGDAQCSPIAAADISLINRTSMLESEALLLKASAHIDNDSGLVHLRHTLGKKNIVLWGPTDYRYFGYDNDANLTSGTCTPCMWFLNNWETCCIKGYTDPHCISAIPVDKVIEALKDQLDEH